MEEYIPSTSMFVIVAAIVASILVFQLVKWIVSLRRVVPTNEVHIVQTAQYTTSYGKSQKDETNKPTGNTYYQWPSWIPKIGVTITIFPTSVFDIALHNYPAYDKDRVPFLADIMAFFRIDDSNIAASRVASFQELKLQLTGIVQGAVRTIMAKATLEEIMSERSVYGEKFTTEVEEQLKQWGVVPVKNIELMDIRDDKESEVIQNIMAKKKSHIEMESRVEVAKNLMTAQEAEIVAQQQVDLKAQEAKQLVGLREAQVVKEVGIANEKASQSVQEEARITKEKDMAVVRVAEEQQAIITKNVNITQAEQEKETTILKAQGNLEAKKKEAEGIKIEGDAKASAESAILLAPVTAQITLAKEIGENEGYQTYLVKLEQIKATQVVGVEQAKALEKADVKIIANTGEPTSGMNNVMDLFTPKGGTSVGGMLEALAQTEQGKELVSKFTTKKPKEPTV